MQKTLLVLFVLVLCANTHAQYTIRDFEPLYSLSGKWRMETKKGFLIEEWHKLNDTTLQNKSYRVNGKDTVLQETVLLKLSNGAISFTPSLPDQNEGKPVTFSLVAVRNKSFVFENKKHDFPQQIIYSPAKKALKVMIRGNTENGFREIPFSFVKM
jgi:hypothetical protein